MSREIQFRAWDTMNKEFLGINFCINSEGNIFELQPEGEFLWLSAIGRTDRYVIQQYTGIKDKNGEPIYEGDVIKCGLGEIFFDTQRAQFRVRWHDKIWKRIRGNNQSYQNGEPLFLNHEISFEVIGNIYETPNLLNQ